MRARTYVIDRDRLADLDLRKALLHPYVLFYGLPLLAGTLLLTAVWFQPWMPMTDLLRAPLSAAEPDRGCCQLYDGAVFNLRVLTWTAATTVCLFAGLQLFCLMGWKPETRFMLISGGLTGLIAIHDLFVPHDQVSALLQSYLPDDVTVAPVHVFWALCVAALAYLASFRRHILKHDTAICVAALAMLVTGVGTGLLQPGATPGRLFVEDGVKLLAVTLWTAFYVRTGLTLCYRAPRFVRLGVVAEVNTEVQAPVVSLQPAIEEQPAVSERKGDLGRPSTTRRPRSADPVRSPRPVRALVRRIRASRSPSATAAPYTALRRAARPRT